MTYDEILLASDGSEAAQAATGHAMRLAESFDATLHVVYVLDAGEHASNFRNDAEHPQIKAKREQALNGPTERAEDAGVPATTVTVRGTPSDALVTYADQEDVDLMVLGTHGRSGLDRLLVGSVAEHVVRNAPVPVVTVRPDQTD